MQSRDELCRELAVRLSNELPIDYSGNIIMTDPLTVATWIISKYKPMIQFDEIEPDPEAEGSARWSWEIRMRVTIADKIMGVTAFEPPELRRQDRRFKQHHREHMRAQLGRVIAEYLMPEVPE